MKKCLVVTAMCMALIGGITASSPKTMAKVKSGTTKKNPTKKNLAKKSQAKKNQAKKNQTKKNQTKASKVKVSKIKVCAITGDKVVVAKGKKSPLTVSVTASPNKKKNQEVLYQSANPKVAAVTKKGVVKGKSQGSTTITVISKVKPKKKKKIKVTVMKNPVKKISLSKVSVDVAPKEKLTLKATISPKKNVYTVLKWESSNTNVATVTSKGVVKGVSVGTAVITAKALDGSGRKATCKVNTGVGIQSVEVYTKNLIRVTLSDAMSLEPEDFLVENKTDNGRFYLEQKNITTACQREGGKIYDLTLRDDIDFGNLKVTISALKVGNTKEITVSMLQGLDDYEANLAEYSVYAKVGEDFFAEWSIDEKFHPYGKVKYFVSDLPDGLTVHYNKAQTKAYISGTFKQVSSDQVATLTMLDERDGNFVQKYHFFVGDDNHIVGQIKDQKVLVYDKEDGEGVKLPGMTLKDLMNLAEESFQILGGSGHYEFRLESGLPEELTYVTVETGKVETEVETAGTETQGMEAPGVKKVSVETIATEASTTETFTTDTTGRKIAAAETGAVETGAAETGAAEVENVVVTDGGNRFIGKIVVTPGKQWKAGTYTLVVQARDLKDPKLTCNLTFTLSMYPGVKITGKVTDRKGQGVAQAVVWAGTNRFTDGRRQVKEVKTKSNGEYTMRLIPGKYAMGAKYDDIFYDLSLQNGITGDGKMDFFTTLYRVGFKVTGEELYDKYKEAEIISDEGVDSYIRWDEDQKVLYDYCLPGTYYLKKNPARTFSVSSDTTEVELR